LWQKCHRTSSEYNSCLREISFFQDERERRESFFILPFLGAKLCRHSGLRFPKDSTGNNARGTICDGDSRRPKIAATVAGWRIAWISIDVLSGARVRFKCRWIVIKWTAMVRTIHPTTAKRQRYQARWSVLLFCSGLSLHLPHMRWSRCCYETM